MERSGPAQSPRVVLYKAEGCHLCELAQAKLAEIAIDGDAELESRYRELIPVVEIDGERICTYYVQPEPFRRKLAAAQTAAKTPGL